MVTSPAGQHNELALRILDLLCLNGVQQRVPAVAFAYLASRKISIVFGLVNLLLLLWRQQRRIAQNLADLII